MTMRFMICIIGVLGLLGCSPRAGELVFRDQAGHTLATGQIDLPGQLPAMGETFTGPWHLRSASKDFPTAAPAGQYRGESLAPEFRINLNPTFADNNLILSGAWTDQQIMGVWSHTTFAGPREGGTFTIERGK